MIYWGDSEDKLQCAYAVGLLTTLWLQIYAYYYDISSTWNYCQNTKTVCCRLSVIIIKDGSQSRIQTGKNLWIEVKRVLITAATPVCLVYSLLRYSLYPDIFYPVSMYLLILWNDSVSVILDFISLMIQVALPIDLTWNCVKLLSSKPCILQNCWFLCYRESLDAFGYFWR